MTPSFDQDVSSPGPSRLAPLPLVLGGAGAGLLAIVSLGAFTGLNAPLLVGVGLALVVAGYGLGQLGGGRWTGWRGWSGLAQAAALATLALGVVGLVQPEAAKLVWAPAMLLLYGQGRAVETAGGPPAWRSSLMMPLLLFSGIAEGAGLLLLLAPLALAEPVPDWAAGLLVGALAVRLLVWMTYRRRIADGNGPPLAAVRLVAFSTPFTLGGTVIPLALCVASGVMPELASAALAAAGLAVAVGGAALKILILIRLDDA
jgi:phenylacetyl-CoA:acceptor oxidoreductase subunit 2